MFLIDGKIIAQLIEQKLAEQLHQARRQPGLAIILVGNDHGSETYVRLKKEAAERIGIQFSLYTFPATVIAKEIEETISWLNQDDEIDGILIQLPLPKQLDENALINKILPSKDADGFLQVNRDAYLSHKPHALAPVLVEGIMLLAKTPQIPLANKKAIIIANTPIFSEPLKEALLREKMTVSVFIDKTANYTSELRAADVIIVARGSQHLISSKDTRDDAIIIDVGFNRSGDFVFGDVDTESYTKTNAWITPVPGGVGPVTVAMLLKRTVALAKHAQP